MIREDVYKLIDGEREYQDTDPHNVGHDDISRSVADWIIFIERQLSEAKGQVYVLDKEKALCHIRKIAALAVACMEHYDTPRRKRCEDKNPL